MTSSRYRRVIVVLGSAAALALPLAACTASDADTSSSASESASEVDASDLASCLIGTWDADESLVGYNGPTEAGVEVTSSGEIVLVFDEETMTVTESQVTTLTGEDETVGAWTVNRTRDGSATLAYTLDGDLLTYTEVTAAEGSDVVVSEADTEETETTETEYAEIVAARVGGERQVTCDEETLTFTEIATEEETTDDGGATEEATESPAEATDEASVDATAEATADATAEETTFVATYHRR